MSEKKIIQASKVAISYLRAVGVEAEQTGFGQLAVPTRDGGKVAVALVSDLTQVPANAAVAVLAEELASPDLDKAMAAFHAITRAAGQGEPIPVNRGPKIHVYGDDFFLIVARHTEYRRAPDLTGPQMSVYMPIIRREVRSFVAKNVRLLSMMGYDADDCETFAKLWTTIYVHTSELPSKVDNERLLTRHIRDQFYHMVVKMRRARAGQMPDADLASSVLRHKPTTFAAEESVDPRQDEDTMQAAANAGDTTQTEQLRRRKAAEKILKKNLERLDHSTMVERLTECVNNTAREYAVRLEARKHLRSHVLECATCRENGVEIPDLSNHAA